MLFDSVLKAPENPSVHSEPPKDNWDWVRQNLVNPAINATVVDAVNVTHVGKMNRLQVQENVSLFSKEWAAQTAASVAGIVPYIIAGRALGAASRAAAESLPLERTAIGRALGRFAASERWTGITGAAAYEFARDPENADKHTTMQNLEARTIGATATAVSFRIFSGQWNPAATGVKLLGEKLAFGGAGGATGALISNINDGDWSAPHVTDKVLHGVVNGMAVPGFMHLGVRGANFVDTNILGRGVPIGRYASEKGWTDNAEINRQIGGEARLVRVGAHSDETKLVGNTIRPNTNLDTLQQQGELAHEAEHRIQHLAAEPRFKAAAANLTDGKPELAKSQVIEILRDQEFAAINSQRRALGQAELPQSERPERFDDRHEQLFAEQAQKFIDSKGTYRPEEYLVRGGARGDGPSSHPRLLKSGAWELTKEGLRHQKFDTPTEVFVANSNEKVLATEQSVKTDASGNISYQKINVADGREIEWWENGKEIGIGQKDDRGFQNTFTANRRETGIRYDVNNQPNAYSRFHISKQSQLPNETLAEGAIYDVFHSTGFMSSHGLIHTIEFRPPFRGTNTAPDAEFGDAIYRYKPKGDGGFAVWEHGKPVIEHLAGTDVAFNETKLAGDGTLTRSNKEGGSYTEFPRGNAVELTLPNGKPINWLNTEEGSGWLNDTTHGKPVEVSQEGKVFVFPNAKSIQPTAHGGELGGDPPAYIEKVEGLYRAPGGSTVYMTQDGYHFLLRPNPRPKEGEARVDVYRLTPDAGSPETADSMGSAHTFYENYGQEGKPSGIDVLHPDKLTVGQGLPATYAEISPAWTRMLSPDGVADIYHEPQSVTFDMGNGHTTTAKTGRSIYTINKAGQIADTVELLDNNVRYTRFLEPRKDLSQPEVEKVRDSIRGKALGVWHNSEGQLKYHMKGIQWPQFEKDVAQVNTLSAHDGTSLDHLLSTPITQVARHYNGVVYSNASGETVTVANNQIMVRKPGAPPFAVQESAVTENFGVPVETPFGYTNQIKVHANGSAEVTIVPNPDGSYYPPYTAVRVFPQPAALGTRSVTMAEHLREGQWNLIFENSSDTHMSSTDFYGRFGDFEHL